MRSRAASYSSHARARRYSASTSSRARHTLTRQPLLSARNVALQGSPRGLVGSSTRALRAAAPSEKDAASDGTSHASPPLTPRNARSRWAAACTPITSGFPQAAARKVSRPMRRSSWSAWLRPKTRLPGREGRAARWYGRDMQALVSWLCSVTNSLYRCSAVPDPEAPCHRTWYPTKLLPRCCCSCCSGGAQVSEDGITTWNVVVVAAAAWRASWSEGSDTRSSRRVASDPVTPRQCDRSACCFPIVSSALVANREGSDSASRRSSWTSWAATRARRALTVAGCTSMEYDAATSFRSKKLDGKVAFPPSLSASMSRNLYAAGAAPSPSLSASMSWNAYSVSTILPLLVSSFSTSSIPAQVAATRSNSRPAACKILRCCQTVPFSVFEAATASSKVSSKASSKAPSKTPSLSPGTKRGWRSYFSTASAATFRSWQATWTRIRARSYHRLRLQRKQPVSASSPAKSSLDEEKSDRSQLPGATSKVTAWSRIWRHRALDAGQRAGRRAGGVLASPFAAWAAPGCVVSGVANCAPSFVSPASTSDAESAVVIPVI